MSLAVEVLASIGYVFDRIATNCETISSESADFKNLHNEVKQTLSVIEADQKKASEAPEPVQEPDKLGQVLEKMAALDDKMEAIELHLAVVSEMVTPEPTPEPEPEPAPEPEPTPEPAPEPAQETAV